jgi:pimeloyl-ACP methyl ester carboxylesterase
MMIVALAALPAQAAERWETLPLPQAPPAAERSGHVKGNGISIYYAIYGHGSPVILLHGGLGISEVWGNQIPALARYHTVIVMDSRGHGRTTRDARPFSYDLMADDAVALMDALKVPKADIVGWSDGAIIALDLAMRHGDRVGKIVAFGANTLTSGMKDDFDKTPTVSSVVQLSKQWYEKYSPTPTEFQAFFDQINKMWNDQPNWTNEQLKATAAPVLVMDGDHDEYIKREHTEYIANTIPGAGLLILPNASHFALWQDPVLFNYALLHFLGDE